MQCPVCDVTLSISSREGIEIDFCPQCRRVWLDRGELDKIIERAAPPAVPPCRGYDEPRRAPERSEEHTSELQSLMRISYAVFCLKKKTTTTLPRPDRTTTHHQH